MSGTVLPKNIETFQAYCSDETLDQKLAEQQKFWIFVLSSTVGTAARRSSERYYTHSGSFGHSAFQKYCIHDITSLTLNVRYFFIKKITSGLTHRIHHLSSSSCMDRYSPGVPPISLDWVRLGDHSMENRVCARWTVLGRTYVKATRTRKYGISVDLKTLD
jgi:hypothetical protein